MIVQQERHFRLNGMGMLLLRITATTSEIVLFLVRLFAFRFLLLDHQLGV